MARTDCCSCGDVGHDRSSFPKLLGARASLFSQEWPEGTDLWYEEIYSRVSKLDLHTGSRVVKRWYFATNSTAFADELRKYSVCQGGHEHFRTEGQKIIHWSLAGSLWWPRNAAFLEPGPTRHA